MARGVTQPLVVGIGVHRGVDMVHGSDMIWQRLKELAFWFIFSCIVLGCYYLLLTVGKL